MSARRSSAPRALGAFVAFIGMSAVAGLLVTAMVTPALAVSGMAANNTIGVFEGLPEYLKINNLGESSTMYANQGGQPVPIATFYAQNRQEVGWDQIPQVTKDAAIATEDPRFYDHGGVDMVGTIRGALATASGRDVQGGSSITQQYVKNVLLSKCEVYNKKVDNEEQQANLDKQYTDCYDDATAVTPNRKLREIKLAIGVEKRYTKDQILQGYLNIAGFGGNVYGIQAAAKHYFNVDASALSLDQSATLIAIVNNPNLLRIDRTAAQLPSNNADNGFKATLERRDYVLDRMLVAKKITSEQHDAAIALPITPTLYDAPNGCATAASVDGAFFCNMVVNRILQDPSFGATTDDRDNFLRQGGLKIYTTLNLDLQAEAQQALSSYIPATSTRLNLGAASTAVELNTGRVITMVQNRPYDTGNTNAPDVTQVNYAADYLDGGSTGFQTGSTYKAFTLLDWIEEGHSINDSVNASNTEITIPASRFHNSCGDTGTWKVGNDTPGEGGTMSVLSATARSVNTAFAAMGQRLDLCKITETAEDLGIHTAFPYARDANGATIRASDGTPEPSKLFNGPSSILGVNELSPLTLATAYGGIGNMGKVCTSVVMDKITDSTGKDIPVPQTTCTQGIDPNVTAQAAVALQAVFTGGTATQARPGDGVAILGKTGTTDHAEQNWLATSTSKVATATWVGNVQGTKQSNGRYANLNFRNISFNGVNGRNVKFSIAKPILRTLNSVYGGDAFPTATRTSRATRQVTVPDLSGKSPQDAQTILEGLGFTYTDGGQVDSAQTSGLVAATSPAAGTPADVGSSVSVQTSNGALKTLPNVVDGKTTYGQASKTLQDLGMKTIPNGSNDPGAVVTAMDPGAGSAVKQGTTVTLTVKSG